MRVAVPKEIVTGERRVALVPDAVRTLRGAGADVVVQQGAGEEAGFGDAAYREAGAELRADAAAVWTGADVVLKVQPPAETGSGEHEADRLRSGAVVIGMLQPFGDAHGVRRLAERGATSLALELVPRISRAQSMDALSSQATVAGYKAVLLAADRAGRFFPMLVTAAGTIPPAQVLVIGAGVAGLQAIATARRLGARVEAFDIRPEVKEQVESLGATFVELELEPAEGEGGYAREVSADEQRRERELLAERVAAADIVVTTAQVPAGAAPVLVTEEMVEAMRAGSVIVDLAAASGGNCALTEAGREVRRGGVAILGPTNLPAALPYDASRMYARNITTLLSHITTEDGRLDIDLDDDITGACVVTHGGRLVNERVREALQIGA